MICSNRGFAVFVGEDCSDEVAGLILLPFLSYCGPVLYRGRLILALFFLEKLVEGVEKVSFLMDVRCLVCRPFHVLLLLAFLTDVVRLTPQVLLAGTFRTLLLVAPARFNGLPSGLESTSALPLLLLEARETLLPSRTIELALGVRSPELRLGDPRSGEPVLRSPVSMLSVSTHDRSASTFTGCCSANKTKQSFIKPEPRITEAFSNPE